jgi:hypothetical protein
MMVLRIHSKLKLLNTNVKDGEPKSQKFHKKKKKSLKLMELLFHKKIKKDWTEEEKLKKKKN